jgi:hypothetical protein
MKCPQSDQKIGCAMSLKALSMLKTMGSIKQGRAMPKLSPCKGA